MELNVIEEMDKVSKLKFDDIAFPKIDYQANAKLNLKSTTLLAAYTTISERVDKDFIKEIEWNRNGDIHWQNEMLEYLSSNIYKMISDYQNDKNDFLLTKIFIWIQLWGANSGRAIFVRGKGWPENFEIEKYRNGIVLTQKGEYIEALEILNSLFGIKTAFSTKHIHFWSRAKAPIYDSIIAAIVFGRNQKEIRANEYPKYLKALEKMKIEINSGEVDVSSIERNLFNWANSENGIKWREIRLSRD